MTRYLSESLQAPEPFFRQGINRLEAANGRPNADIRLSAKVYQGIKLKLKQLGLDPADTTAEELYHVLQERVKSDDAKLTKTLRTLAATHVSADGEVVDGMIYALKNLPESRRCFAIKNSRMKTLIKELSPKKAMKLLGYRSLDSFLKHETPTTILAAAILTEGSHWQHNLFDKYKKLQAKDFEDRNIAIIQPDSKRWRELAKAVVSDKKHNVLCLKEMGALVVFSLPADVPPGVVTASLSLALHELNEIRACSTYLKLCQVRPDFGSLVQVVAADEPKLNSQLLDMPVPWHLIQRFFAFRKQFGGIFEDPHVRLEDMAWYPVEKTLASIEPELSFWSGSAHLGLVQNKKPVSLNIVDVALNCCNHMPFEQRIVHYFQRSLWHELLLSYLRLETVDQAVQFELQPRLAKETVSL